MILTLFLAEDAAVNTYVKAMEKLRNEFPLEEAEILGKNQEASRAALDLFRNDTKLDTDPKNFEQKQRIMTVSSRGTRHSF